MGGSTIDASMLWPLLIMAVAMTLLYLALLLMAMRNGSSGGGCTRSSSSRRGRPAEPMEEASRHIGFIVAAYGVTVVVLLGVVAWIVVDGIAQRRRLRDLEARGVRRRSGPAAP
jgi:heme exporter protein D